MNQLAELLKLSNLAYERRRPQETILCQTVEENHQTVLAALAKEKTVPYFIKNEFEKFLKCGILSEGFIRVHCPTCNHNLIVAFSCKGRGICPACGARRM
ncbi:MAG: hypothetical protein A2381_16420 [Bdellovibrionales bacterium RIFOXYB1_FULL_37_110]|nr:MAG: hypothetical protein A2381_16420 [Bdellovibrionales bacterium RIFOXYB1_FULL_37_110]